MLEEISIRNLAVIESVRVRFTEGFQVLTGETGAGKSMIIDALSLLIGGRASTEWIRHGTDRAEIEGLFALDADHPVWQVLQELGIEADSGESLLIRREISAGGKSYARVNGQIVNLSMLKKIGEWLVNIHGQHEHQSLLKVERHLQWLDQYGDRRLSETKQRYQKQYEAYRQIEKELNELLETSKQNLQMLDLYRFQCEEIEKAALQPGEDESLQEERNRLANAEKLFQSVSESYEHLYGNPGALDAAGQALRLLESAATVDSAALRPVAEQIQSAYYQLEDAAHQLRHYRDGIEFNPARLDEIEQRLDLIAALRRKYGNTVEDILHHYEEISQELNRIENRDEEIARLQDQLEQAEKTLSETADELTRLRKKTAKRLTGQIEKELADLQMERTRFEVKFNSRQPRFAKDGADDVEFMISPNPGEPPRPLHKIASGGELSRIMLALKTIFARMERIPVLVFDEVDTGVSGRAAQAVAEKLSALAENCQVFSITHLPQVACMADGHYEIRKHVEKNKTYTRVTRLEGEERVRELARMLSGVEVTETTEHHAKEMLVMAAHNKERRNHFQ